MGISLGNGPAGIDQPGPHLTARIGRNLAHRYFHDTIPCNVDTRGLQIEKAQRAIQFEFHLYDSLCFVSM